MNILRYAFKNIFRNFFLSISSILTIALLVFFVNILLLVVHSSETFIASVNDKIAVTISFQKWYNNTQIRSQEFLSGAKDRFPGISVAYISREEAWTIFAKRHADLASVIEDAEENPLPNVVQFSQIPLEKYEDFSRYIESYKDIITYKEGDMQQQLIDFQTQYQNIMKTVELLRLLTQAVYVLIGLFLITMFVMVHMTIRNFVFFMQDEVRIIELVGGRPSFIYGPLMVQGIIYTTLAVCLAFLIFFIFQATGGVQILPADIATMFSGFYKNLSEFFLPVELLAAMVVGILSAMLASYKYIHSTIRE